MAHLDFTVKKQGEQIDGLQKATKDHETRITTLETQGMATSDVTTTPPQQVEYKVSIPDDIVRKTDLDNAVRKITERQPTSSGSITISPMTTLEKTDFTKAIKDVVSKEVAEPLSEMKTDMAARNKLLANKVTNIQLEAENKNLRRILMLSIGISFMVCVVIVWNMIESSSEIEHLKRVEWLYRWSRINRPDSEEFQDFERRMLQGSKEEREGLKTKIFHLERKAPQFQYFRPVDDWQPEPPKEEEAKKPDTDTRDEHKGETKPQQSTTKTLPHKRRTNLTPGEIAAIKAMRANPHIPEDAKPSLPEGYE